MTEAADEGDGGDEDTHYRALIALGFPARVARRMADQRKRGAR